MAKPFDLLSLSAQERLTQFDTSFDGALVTQTPEVWSKMFGRVLNSRAIATKFPLSVSAAKFRLRDGDDKMRGFANLMLSIKPEEWQDGVQEKAWIVEAPDFIGWAGEPERMAIEALRNPNILVAAMLEANGILEFDGQNLFDTDHPVNPFDSTSGVFINVFDTPATFANAIVAAKIAFRARKSPNGRPMGLRVTHVLAPASREEEIRDYLESDTLIQAVTNVLGTENVAAGMVKNRHAGTVTPIFSDELTNADDVYFIDANGPPPYVVQDGGAPETITYGKDDALYKDKGMIGVKKILLQSATAALPHAIERRTLS